MNHEDIRKWCHEEMGALADSPMYARGRAILALVNAADAPPWLADAAEALGEVRHDDGAPLALNWTQVLAAESAEYALAPHLGKNGHIQREPQTGYGEPGVRDPDNRCDMYSPGKPTNGECQGDGHHLCGMCARARPALRRHRIEGELLPMRNSERGSGEETTGAVREFIFVSHPTERKLLEWCEREGWRLHCAMCGPDGRVEGIAERPLACRWVPECGR